MTSFDARRTDFGVRQEAIHDLQGDARFDALETRVELVPDPLRKAADVVDPAGR